MPVCLFLEQEARKEKKLLIVFIPSFNITSDLIAYDYNKLERIFTSLVVEMNIIERLGVL
jgi:hypothetical protein